MRKMIVLVIAACLLSMPVRAQPVTQCDKLPPSASIQEFSSADTVPLCREVLRVLQGVTIEDLLSFEVFAVVFSHEGYKEGKFAQIVAELVDIIRLRGLYNQRTRWKPTGEIAWKAYQATNRLITPHDIVVLLKESGSMAKTLSDNGLITLILLLDSGRRQGDYD
jgi:hypothetical protein